MHRLRRFLPRVPQQHGIGFVDVHTVVPRRIDELGLALGADHHARVGEQQVRRDGHAMLLAAIQQHPVVELVTKIGHQQVAGRAHRQQKLEGAALAKTRADHQRVVARQAVHFARPLGDQVVAGGHVKVERLLSAIGHNLQRAELQDVRVLDAGRLEVIINDAARGVEGHRHGHAASVVSLDEGNALHRPADRVQDGATHHVLERAAERQVHAVVPDKEVALAGHEIVQPLLQTSLPFLGVLLLPRFGLEDE